jgi:cytochrome c biogenesis protein CcmG/thiol:disulfide interchange protein DsbE
MLRDGEGATRESYGILGFPETFVIDRRGRIAAAARGPVDEQFMRKRVEPLLRQSS